MKIRVGVSNRHIHLCKDDAETLFGKNYEFKKRNDLTQTGEYACEEVVKVSTDKYEFPYVRVLGPLREYTQVEVSRDDSLLLGINPPVRDSGDLENSESVYLEGPNGKIFKKNCCIIANRHIHCNKLDNIDHTNGDIVSVNVNGKVMDNVHIKMKDSYVLELHIDKCDAKEYNLNTGDYIDLE
ncbi:MAG: propanediol utilization protein [Bacilli bacterium]|nr:propanediol utilization protein [Bacilli bacterium]